MICMRNLQEQVKKAFCYQKLFWPFTVWINCSSDLKNFTNSLPSASNFIFFSQSLEHFFHTVGQNNFGNKIPFLLCILTISRTPYCLVWFLSIAITFPYCSLCEDYWFFPISKTKVLQWAIPLLNYIFA